MAERKNFRIGDEVTFNTNVFGEMGFWKSTIYIVNEIIDNLRVTLVGYPDNLISKKYLELVKMAK